MRAGACTIQQGLTAEAASTVKQAIGLARRRGHAQVTPLHVAGAMLASPTGLFRTACLQSHSHPLQCKALELCFNVALNRLPTSASSPILGPPSYYPCLSNALVAAFKRAQAHQRRGSVESQQQPILAVKVEVEQLTISVLDDPSVSRVMREAGFSSTQVKNNVEQTVSLEICSQSPPVSNNQSKESTSLLVLSPSVSESGPLSQFGFKLHKPSNQARNEDVMSVIDTLMSKRKRNTVIVGECFASTECVVRGVMDKLEKGDVPSELRYLQFISLPLCALQCLSREEVEKKVMELRCIVKSYVNGGVVLFVGDLKWVCEYRAIYSEERRKFYCPVEEMIMEIRRIVHGMGENRKLWLMGVATFQTYMRCQKGHPSLEAVWELHPLTIPVGSLSLSLNLESNVKVQSATSNPRFKDSTPTSPSSSLPSWLQQYKEEKRRKTMTDQEYYQVSNLCKNWNSFCSSPNKHPHLPTKILLSNSSSPSSSTSVSSYDQRCQNLNQAHLTWPLMFKSKESQREHLFLISEDGCEGSEHPKPDLLSNPNSIPNSESSSDTLEEEAEEIHSFKELNLENLRILSNGLEKKVPTQKVLIADIVNTILQSRSGMKRRKVKLEAEESVNKEETWLFFLGNDFQGKEKMATELANIVFGSYRNFILIGLCNFLSTKVDSTNEIRNKRVRDEEGSSYLQRFAEALHENPHRVFFLDDWEQVDHISQAGITRAIETGRIKHDNGKSVPLEDAIVVLCSESLSSKSRACSPPPNKHKICEGEDKSNDDDLDDKNQFVSLDLNITFADDQREESSVATDIGILESVDGHFLFKIQE
ncbi:Clp, repeat (R) domain [Dillenia turbinata]|uniref:Clp, repeat (R) domain n=1 Tax=Dillenia turbinata TaxID=194707 RepID=A0AAN8ZCX9_9MAGN